MVLSLKQSILYDMLNIVLSKREKEVAEALISGIRIKDIASHLNVKQSTISTYRYRILNKIGIDNNIALIRWYIKNNNGSINQELGTVIKIDKKSKKTLEQKAYDSFLILFGDDQEDFFEKCRQSPRRYRRILLDRFSLECNFSLEHEGRLHTILQWMCEITENE